MDEVLKWAAENAQWLIGTVLFGGIATWIAVHGARSSRRLEATRQWREGINSRRDIADQLIAQVIELRQHRRGQFPDGQWQQIDARISAIAQGETWDSINRLRALVNQMHRHQALIPDGFDVQFRKLLYQWVYEPIGMRSEIGEFVRKQWKIAMLPGLSPTDLPRDEILGDPRKRQKQARELPPM